MIRIAELVGNVTCRAGAARGPARSRRPSRRPARSLPPGAAFLVPLVLLASLLFSGCGGAGGSSAFITGITVSDVSVSAGDTVTITATVKDAAQLKSTRWTADGGILATTTGLTNQWASPGNLKVAQDFTITLLAQQTTGLSDIETIKIHVEPAGTSSTGARITGVTVSQATVAPNDTVLATVTVANASDVVDVRWQADQGSFSATTGYSVQWRAPASVGPGVANLTVTTTGRQGDTYVESVKVYIEEAGTGEPSGARITGISVSSPTVAPNEILTATVAVANNADVIDVRWAADLGTLITNQGFSVQWRAPSTEGLATLSVTTTDANGAKFTESVRVFVEQGGGGALSGARITSLTASADTVDPSDIVTATVEVADKSDVVSVTWTADRGTLLANQGYSVRWRAPDVVTENTWATLTVTSVGRDGDTNTANLSILILSGNSGGGGSSLISKVTLSSGSATSGQSITLTVEPADPANVDSIVWTANGGTLTSTSGATVAWVAPTVTTQTVYSIIVTVRNKRGQSSQQEMQIVARP